MTDFAAYLDRSFSIHAGRLFVDDVETEIHEGPFGLAFFRAASPGYPRGEGVWYYAPLPIDSLDVSFDVREIGLVRTMGDDFGFEPEDVETVNAFLARLSGDSFSRLSRKEFFAAARALRDDLEVEGIGVGEIRQEPVLGEIEVEVFDPADPENVRKIYASKPQALVRPLKRTRTYYQLEAPSADGFIRAGGLVIWSTPAGAALEALTR